MKLIYLFSRRITAIDKEEHSGGAKAALHCRGTSVVVYGKGYSVERTHRLF